MSASLFLPIYTNKHFSLVFNTLQNSQGIIGTTARYLLKDNQRYNLWPQESYC